MWQSEPFEKLKIGFGKNLSERPFVSLGGHVESANLLWSDLGRLLFPDSSGEKSI
jgi:hypothetical protein